MRVLKYWTFLGFLLFLIPVSEANELNIRSVISACFEIQESKDIRGRPVTIFTDMSEDCVELRQGVNLMIQKKIDASEESEQDSKSRAKNCIPGRWNCTL